MRGRGLRCVGQGRPWAVAWTTGFLTRERLRPWCSPGQQVYADAFTLEAQFTSLTNGAMGPCLQVNAATSGNSQDPVWQVSPEAEAHGVQTICPQTPWTFSAASCLLWEVGTVHGARRFTKGPGQDTRVRAPCHTRRGRVRFWLLPGCGDRAEEELMQSPGGAGRPGQLEGWVPLSQGVGCSRPTAVPLRARQLSESIKNQSNDTANINYSRETRNGIDLEGAALLLVIETLCEGGEGPGLGGRGQGPWSRPEPAPQHRADSRGVEAAGGPSRGSGSWELGLALLPTGFLAQRDTAKGRGSFQKAPGGEGPSPTPQLSLLCEQQSFQVQGAEHEPSGARPEPPARRPWGRACS